MFSVHDRFMKDYRVSQLDFLYIAWRKLKQVFMQVYVFQEDKMFEK